jgi:hypothetical protein
MRTTRTVTKVRYRQVFRLITLIALFPCTFTITGCFNNDSPEKGARLWINAALNPDVQVFGQRTASTSWRDSAQVVMMSSGTFSKKIVEFDEFVKLIRMFDDVFPPTEGSVDSDKYVYKLDALTYKAKEDLQSVWVTVSGDAQVYDENKKRNIGKSALFPVVLRMIKERGVWKCNSWIWKAGTSN